MPTIHLHINGLTHHDIAERRKEWLRTAVGRRMVLRAAPCREDARAVVAYAGVDMVGYVARTDLDTAWAAMRGMGVKVLRGAVVQTKDYCVVFESFIEQLAEEEGVTTAVAEGWHYTGPLMAEPEVWQRLDYLSEELELLLNEDAEAEDVIELFEAFCALASYDVSGEMLARRRQLRDLLSASDDERLQEAAERVEELSRRMGGDHVMARIGAWMKHELPQSDEVRGMMKTAISPALRTEARLAAASLPDGLLAEWLTDEVQFARLLYGMRLPRETLLQVLSCLIWSDVMETETSVEGIAEMRVALEAWAGAVSKLSAEVLERNLLALCRLNLQYNHAFDDIELRLFGLLEQKGEWHPTTIYEAGSTHDDKRRQVFLEGTIETDKLLEQKP